MEKPLSAEDHNIYMYYPSSAGGGSQRLFRKVGSQSSKYFSESSVRKTGSYIYEEFLPTDGTDVKVCDFCDSILSRKISSCTNVCTIYIQESRYMYVSTSKYITKLMFGFLPSCLDETLLRPDV